MRRVFYFISSRISSSASENSAFLCGVLLAGSSRQGDRQSELKFGAKCKQGDEAQILEAPTIVVSFQFGIGDEIKARRRQSKQLQFASFKPNFSTANIDAARGATRGRRDLRCTAQTKATSNVRARPSLEANFRRRTEWESEEEEEKERHISER